MRTVAVTGTNGKSSTTAMIASIVRASGARVASVTTVGMRIDDEVLPPAQTLEDFDALHRRARAEGIVVFALEVTSRSLAAGFAARYPPDIAVLTNLTRDHLDRHKTMEAYLAAKAQLFVHLRPGGTAVLNVADAASDLLAEITPPDRARCGYSAGRVRAGNRVPVILAADLVTPMRNGTRITLAPSPLADDLGGGLDLSVLGAFQADNALAAAVATHAAGVPAAAIVDGLGSFEGVPGRFEAVGEAPLTIVDYAHTPDALARTLATARAVVQEHGRVWIVFGCGGDRDHGKRAEMGRVAEHGSDHVVLTTDNPRNEAPTAIAAMVQEAMSERWRWHVELDRAAAIAYALEKAADQDVVVIAGKGHERVQYVKDLELPFDDRQHARDALAVRRVGAQ